MPSSPGVRLTGLDTETLGEAAAAETGQRTQKGAGRAARSQQSDLGCMPSKAS